MRRWKLPNGNYLREGDPVPFPTSYVHSIRLPGGEELLHTTPYDEVTSEGHIVATYSTARAYSLEDVLYIYDFHAVTEGQFCKFLWQEQWKYESRIEVSAVIYTGLVDCPVSDLPFDPATLDLRIPPQ